MNKLNKIKNKLKNNKRNKCSKALLVALLLTGGISSYAKEDTFSNQVFFSTNFYNTKNNDNTLENFKTEEYEKDEIGKSERRGTGFINRYGKFFGGNGIVLETTDFYDTVSFAAKIQPKAAPNVKAEKPVTKKIQIDDPNIQKPQNKSINVEMDDVDEPELEEIKIPEIVNPHIEEPKPLKEPKDMRFEKQSNIEKSNQNPQVITIKDVPKPDIKANVKPTTVKQEFISIPHMNIKIEKEDINPSSGGSSYQFALKPDYDTRWWYDKNKVSSEEKTRISGIVQDISLTGGTYEVKENGNGLTAKVQGYQAKTYGDNETVLGEKPKDGTYEADNIRYFATLSYSPYTEFGKDVTIDFHAPSPLVAIESGTTFKEKTNDYSIEAYEKLGKIDHEKAESLKKAKQFIKYTGGVSEKEVVFRNKGTLTLSSEGSKVFLLNRYKDNDVIDFIDNDGKITLSGDNSTYLVMTNNQYNPNPRLIMTNSKNGEIKMTGKNSQFLSTSGSASTVFVNHGKIEITGADSTGFNNVSNLILNEPITLNGTRIVGVVGIAHDLPNIIKINIGEQSRRSVGILNDMSKNKTAKSQTDVDIRIRGEKNYGVLITDRDSYVSIGKENHQDSRIVIEGGKKNTAISAAEGSKVIMDAELSVTGGSEHSIANVEDASIIIKGDVKVGTENNYIKDTIVFNTTGQSSSIALQGEKKKEFYLQGKSALAYAYNAGKSLTNLGMDLSGAVAYFKNLNNYAAIYANDSYIKADKVKLTVQGNGAAVAAMGKSKISLQESTVDFTGAAYALYAYRNSEIDISKSKIYLSNGAVGLDIDEKAKKQNIIMDNDTRIIPKTDDVIVFNLKRFKEIDTRNGIRENIIKVAERKLNEDGRNVNLTNLVEATGKYKVAAIDGGKIIIGSLDKSGKIEDDINGLTGSAKKDGYQYYNLFQAQRLKAETVPGSTIRAVLTNKEAKNFFDQVVALEMNSSGNARSNNDTQINLKGTKLIADRIDSGAGAIGMFVNYGKISIDKDSTVDVETEQNTVNDGAIGAYAVNGAETRNEGKISVGGNSSAGIFSMSYRLGQDGKPLGDEFRKTKRFGKGQGMLKVHNSGDIKVTGNKSVGIYAINNNDKSLPISNDVINKGNIYATSKNSVGIYGDRVNINNSEGQVYVGNEGIGIYSKSSNLNTKDDLGTIYFNGDNGVGLYLAGKYDKENTFKSNSKITLKTKGEGNVGIFVALDNEENFETDLHVASEEGDIISYYSKSSNIAVISDIISKKGGIGIAAAAGKNIEYRGKANQKLRVSKGGIGIYGSENKVLLNGDMEIIGQKGLGIYSHKKGTVEINKQVSFGEDVEDATGVQVLDGSIVNVNIADSISFNSDPKTKENLGYYLNKSTINFKKDFEFSNNNNNIYVLAKNESKINFNEASIAGKGAVGFYLEDNSSIIGNKLGVSQKAIGIYSKNNMDKVNIINSIDLNAEDGATGIYSESKTKLNNVKVNAQHNSIGVYSAGEVLLDEENTVKLDDTSVGFFLDLKGTIQYGTLNIENIVGNKQVVGVYYLGDKTKDIVRNYTSTIKVTDQNKVIANYLKESKINIGNDGKVSIKNGLENIGAYLTQGSVLVNEGEITLSGVEDGVGIYANKSIAENKNKITVDNTSVAMIGVENSTLKNSGQLQSSHIGMYIENSSGINTGTIKAKVGVRVDGETSSFKNTGLIEAENAGIYLSGTKENKILASDITLTKNNAIGVYAKDSIVDFDIAPKAKENTSGVVSLYALGNTAIKGKITTSNAKNSVGVYVKDNGVSFEKGSVVNVTEGVDGSYNTGIYISPNYQKDLNVDIFNEKPLTIGLRISKDSNITAFNGKITTKGENSIGALVEGKLTTTEKSNFDVSENGIGIYINKGSAVIEKGTFKLNDATAIHQNEGTITIGKDVNILGDGTILSSKNSDITLNNSFTVGEDNVGIISIYDDNKNHSIVSNGTIKLKDDAIGISAVSEHGNKVKIKNTGTIKNDGETEKTIGIYAKNADIENTGTIEANTGIYATGIVKVTNVGTINVKEDNAMGIFGNKLIGHTVWETGKISGNGEMQVGVYIKENSEKITLNNANIELQGVESKAVAFKDGNDFEISNSKLSVGENGVAIASFNTNGNIDQTELTLGENATGIYIEGEKTLSFSGKLTGQKGSTLAYARDKGKINLNVEKLSVVSEAVGLATRNGTIETSKDTNVEVSGGIGAYMKGDSETEKANISDKFKIEVQDDGIGVYAIGHVDSMPMTVNLKGNNAKGFLLENFARKFSMENIKVGENDKTHQIGIYSFGDGSGLEIKNITVLGVNNYGIYNTANQIVNVENINVENSEENKNSIGIYSKTGTVNISDKISVGEHSVGTYIVKGTINQLSSEGAMKSGNSGISIYATKDSIVNMK